MIERDFIAQKTKEYYIKQHISETLKGAEISEVTLKKIPLGEKIVVLTNRPSLVVGSKGSNIRAITRDLKVKFGLENPQVEIKEVVDANLDAHVVAQRIASTLERFGSARFKGTGHKVLSDVMGAGALGVEIKISGKIPGSRAKSWRFYMGYLKKCGDVSVSGVLKSYSSAHLKSGVVGIQVRIMPKDVVLPDTVTILDEAEVVFEELPLDGDKTDKKDNKQSVKKKNKAKSKKNKDTKKEIKQKKKKAKKKDNVEKSAEGEDIEKVEKVEKKEPVDTTLGVAKADAKVDAENISKHTESNSNLANLDQKDSIKNNTNLNIEDNINDKTKAETVNEEKDIMKK